MFFFHLFTRAEIHSEHRVPCLPSVSSTSNVKDWPTQSTHIYWTPTLYRHCSTLQECSSKTDEIFSVWGLYSNEKHTDKQGPSRQWKDYEGSKRGWCTATGLRWKLSLDLGSLSKEVTFELRSERQWNRDDVIWRKRVAGGKKSLKIKTKFGSLRKTNLETGERREK